MGQKRTGKPPQNEEYADGKSMHTLRRYLCTLALPSPKASVYVDACRGCESQCGFGRRYVELYDAGAPEKKPRGPYKPRKKKSANAKPDKPVSVTTILEETQKIMMRRLDTPKETDGGAHTWQTAKAAQS